MKKKLVKGVAVMAAGVLGVVALAAPVAADGICGDLNIPQDIRIASGCDGGAGDKLPQAVIGILNVIIGLLGIVAVIAIVFGGVQYMTSSGDAGKVKKAKDTILYAVIGLIVCILAFAIVNFAIGV